MPYMLRDVIRVTEEPDGVHYRLPGHHGSRGVGVGLLVGCLVVAAFMGFLLNGIIEESWDEGDFWGSLALTGFLAVVFGWLLWRNRRYAVVCWLNLFGHAEVRLDRGRLYASLCAGPLRIIDARPVAELRRLVVRPWATARPSAGGWDQTGLGSLAAETPDGKWWDLAFGYPLDWLRSLADDLAERSQLPSGNEPIDHPPARSLPVSIGAVLDPFEARAGPPPGSRVRFERFPDGVSVRVPGKGVWRAAPRMFTGGLIYVTALGIVSVGLANHFRDNPRMWEREGWGVVAFAVGHWLFAIGLVVRALSWGGQRAGLAVVGDSLIYVQRGLVFSTREEWRRGQIADLRPLAAELGLEGPSYQSLQIRLADGGRRELLAGRDPAELEWIATVLRRALGLPVLDRPVDPNPAGGR